VGELADSDSCCRKTDVTAVAVQTAAAAVQNIAAVQTVAVVD
jgi:hypothetical protein